VIGSARDVTERRRLESQQRALDAWRADVQRLESLSALATGVAHDLNNVLTAILGRAELVCAALPPDSRIGDDVRHIQVAARRAEELARQLHVYSGEGEPVLEPISLSALVREMAPLLTAALPRRVTLDLELGDDLPLVDADPLLLPQVVTNLVVNASEAIGDVPGTVTIRTSVRPFDPEGHPEDDLGRILRLGSYVGLDVCDTGIGMDEKTMARLFDPFFTTKGTGRGLGLAAVRGIVLEHGAPIHISSARGAGSTVSVSFRLSTAAVLELAEPVAPDPQGEARAPRAPAARPAPALTARPAADADSC
jgi:two-component system cell cycle sensor histidine kinase/response regulator CckA